MGKIELKFRKVIFYMEDRAYIMVLKMVNFLEFFAIVPKIPSPKHHENQEFGQNYDISDMKFSNFT
jgi:hypothetical protein